MRILFVGDVVGKPGRSAVRHLLPGLRRRHEADFVIVNIENAAGGFGFTPDIAREVLDAGADCLTSGNHVWKKREAYGYIDIEPRVLRPANYPDGAPGRGYAVYMVGGQQVAVANLMGRVFMEALDCPFRLLDQVWERIKDDTNVFIVDFHAETTSEKQAMGWYAAGRASAVIGTHTHVQTADERILPGGTAYLTDVGMTGPVDGVLGVEADAVIEKFLTQMPVKFEVARGPSMLMAVLLELDDQTGRARRVARLQEPWGSEPDDDRDDG
jgi:2',3'-cyclic-nucleotide 2'-phosphodiesterase